VAYPFTVSIELSESERRRYAGQIEGELGLEGQLALKRARAIVVGARAAGSAAAAQLVSCGVGYVAVVDGGTVALPDLAGQTLYYTPDVGTGMAETLAAKLSLLNPEVQVESYPVEPDAENAGAIVEGHDVVLICTDDASVGQAVSAACEASGLPFSSVVGNGSSPVAAGAGLAAHVVSSLAARAEQEARP
jgi:molybdopterin/thiamine biosynthesis adenylyltransferase